MQNFSPPLLMHCATTACISSKSKSRVALHCTDQLLTCKNQSSYQEHFVCLHLSSLPSSLTCCLCTYYLFPCVSLSGFFLLCCSSLLFALSSTVSFLLHLPYLSRLSLHLSLLLPLSLRLRFQLHHVFILFSLFFHLSASIQKAVLLSVASTSKICHHALPDSTPRVVFDNTCSLYCNRTIPSTSSRCTACCVFPFVFMDLCLPMFIFVSKVMPVFLSHQQVWPVPFFHQHGTCAG